MDPVWVTRLAQLCACYASPLSLSAVCTTSSFAVSPPHDEEEEEPKKEKKGSPRWAAIGSIMETREGQACEEKEGVVVPPPRSLPHPRAAPLALRLLVSFDDPSWPQGEAYALLTGKKGSLLPPSPAMRDSPPPLPSPSPSLKRCTRPMAEKRGMGVRNGVMGPMAMVYLTSALFPRLEERRDLLPAPHELLLQYETASAGSGGGGGGPRGAAGLLSDTRGGEIGGTSSSSPRGPGKKASSSTTVSLQRQTQQRVDTIRRVLMSVPIGFCHLFRHLVMAQLEVGEGEYISVFLLVELLEEKSGTLISQGRWRAVQKELTSNRLGLYDPGEHALLIPQPHLFFSVLEEVTKERESSSGGSGGVPMPES